MFLLFYPGLSGAAFVLLGTRLLWIYSPPYCVLYCPGFSGTAFCSDRVPASLGTSPFIVCFNVLTSLEQHFILLGSGFSESLPIPCGLLLFCPGLSGTAFVLLGSRLHWIPLFCVFHCPGFSGTAFFLLGSRILWVPPYPLCASAFLTWLLWDSFVLLGTRLLSVPLTLLCALLSRLLWDSILFC